MDGVVVDYIKSIVDSLTAHGALASISEEDWIILIGPPKRSRVPVLRVTRGDTIQDKLTNNFVFTFFDGSKGVTPFSRGSANLKDLVHDVNLIMQNFPEFFVKKVAKKKQAK
jgi:hypothetical protein